MRRVRNIAIALALFYLLLVVLAYRFQERLVFFPSKMPVNHTYDFCQDYEEFDLTATDGARLNAVRIKQDSAKGMVLYFHGNSGNISHLGHVANLIHRKGYEAILVDYRTYGKSTGTLSEEALKKDAQQFYDYVKQYYEEDKIVLYGRSFGTGIATGLAAANKPGKLVLESPFYSAVALGKHRFPFLPVDWLSNFRFPSNVYIQNIKCPVFIFHGTADKVIPYEQATRLYDAIPIPNKKLYSIKEGGHNYLQDFNLFQKGMNEVFD